MQIWTYRIAHRRRVCNAILFLGISPQWRYPFPWQIQTAPISASAPCARGPSWGIFPGTALGCAVRFLVHFISGITIYRIYEPKNIPGFGTFDNANLYSLVYNGSYMLPNMLLALAIAAVLYIPLKKYFAGQDIRK